MIKKSLKPLPKNTASNPNQAWLSGTKNGISILNLTPLREQVYQYFRNEMQHGHLIPGSSVNLNQISLELGISKTPLRDALIQLEAEGFVTILPRRGVLVNKLTLAEIQNLYQIIGSLEATVVLAVFEKLTKSHVDRMKQLNAEQISSLKKKDFEKYYRLNLDFHDVFLNLSDNDTLKRIITPLKQRLYDFPRRGYFEDWEKQHLEEHEKLINAIAKSKRKLAASIIRDQHWCFDVHKKYLDRFYGLA
jgi:DNA-binding GntR family transcriptional regulator